MSNSSSASTIALNTLLEATEKLIFFALILKNQRQDSFIRLTCFI